MMLKQSLLMVCATTLSTVVTAEEFPTPEQFKLQMVAEKLIQNGMAMEIKNFKTALAPADVRGFYHQAWADPISETAPGYVEAQVGEWQVISRLTEQDNLLVQMRESDDGGTHGFIAVVDREPSGALSSLAELLPGSLAGDLLSTTESRDGDTTAITAVYRLAGSAEDALAQVERHFLSLDFEVLRKFEQDATRVRFLAGPKGKVELASQQHADGPVLVINVVEP